MNSNTLQQKRDELKATATEANQKLTEAYSAWTKAFIDERDAFSKWSEARDRSRRETAIWVEYESALSIYETVQVEVPVHHKLAEESRYEVLSGGASSRESHESVQINQENPKG